MKRCKWCNLDNPLYVEYHDKEWCILNTNEKYLFEMLILESFQAGLSWQCVLNKREAFRKAMIDIGIEYDENYHFKIYHEINKKIWREFEEGLITQEKLKVERFRRLADKLS